MNFFLSREAKVKKKEEALARERELIEADKYLIDRRAALRQGVEGAKAKYSKCSGDIDAACRFPSAAEFAAAFLNGGFPIKNLAEEMAGRTSLALHSEELKKELWKLLVSASEKTLSDFENANRKALARLPKSEQATEPFVPMRFNDETPVTNPVEGQVRRMLGLKKGETLPPAPWEKGTQAN